MKHLYKYLLPLLFLLSATTLLAQTDSISPHYIEVTGVAEMSIVPDEIYVGIQLKERMQQNVKITVGSQEKRLKDSLLAADIALEDLALNDISSDFIKLSWRKKEVMAYRRYELKVSDTEEAATVFRILENIQADDGKISRVDHSEIERLRREVKTQAIVAAKEKARYLLAAIDEEVGKPLRIVEQETQMNRNNRASNIRVRGANSIATLTPGVYQADSEIAFQKIKLQYQILARFEIR